MTESWRLAMEREFGLLSDEQLGIIRRISRVHEAWLLSGVQERRRGLSSYIARPGLRMLQAAWESGWRDGAPFPPVRAATGADGGRAKLVWWGLAEPVTRRDEAGHGSLFVLTPRGVRFYRGELTVPRYAVLRYRHVSGHEQFRTPEELVRLEGEPWSVTDARVDVFDLRELAV